MYVCMYVCTYVCMYVCMYACMHVCMYAKSQLFIAFKNLLHDYLMNTIGEERLFLYDIDSVLCSSNFYSELHRSQ